MRESVCVHLDNRLVKSSRNLRGILDYARISPVERVDCQRLLSESPGGPQFYPVTFFYDNGAIGQADFQDWRVLVDWIKARRSWAVERFSGLLEFVYAMRAADEAPAPVWSLLAASRPYACQCCGTVQHLTTNHTGPLSGVCAGCNARGLDLPTTGHAPYGGRFPRALAYAGPPVTPAEWNDYNDKAARLRPGMYAGEQGARTREQWEADAIAALHYGPAGVQMRP